MSLRTKLVISFTTLLLVVIAAVGFVASRSIESILINQIDQTLAGFVQRGPLPPGTFGPGPGLSPEPEQQGEQVLRSIAEVIIDADGGIVLSLPSGFLDDPDPLPDVSNIPDTDEPYFVSSVDGTIRYRAVARPLPDEIAAGAILIRAAPLAEVSAATSSLVRALLLAGLGVLLLGGAATRWTVERSMSPVDQMVGTAEAIAAGDLSQRVPQLNPDTELGRLGASLNEMLTNIENAVQAERDSKARLRQFMADASHELRTPLTAIAGYAELSRKGGLNTPEAEEKAWSRIQSESQRMGSLIEDLLTLTRLGQSQPLQIDRVDVAAIVRNAVTDHRVIDDTRPVRVTGPESIFIEVDGERLHQMIANLLSNVRVHTPPGTHVEITMRERTTGVTLELSDDGVGIPEAALPHVFDRLYRADPSRSRRSGGSGLGLAIVDAIVTAHGGTVSAANIESGGARFTIDLPRDNSEQILSLS
jgi:two-component system OmpR family sensor kinase